MNAYVELTKPRILVMQLVTLSLGFFLAPGDHSATVFLVAMVGTGLVSGGAAVWNHVLEKDVDAKMERTMNRPLPKGIISTLQAAFLGTLLLAAGLLLLVFLVNALTAFLAFLTAFLYVAIYTPLKRISWLNTMVGAVPGALPPLGGWAAATGSLSPQSWVLFALLFVWQLPHFYAIAWMYKTDYERGGFKMLSVIDDDGSRSARQILIHSTLLLAVSFLPFYFRMLGLIYLVGALILGIYLIREGLQFAKTKSHTDARRVLKASVYYLCALLALVVVDKAVG